MALTTLKRRAARWLCTRSERAYRTTLNWRAAASNDAVEEIPLTVLMFVGERHTRTHFTRGPFWADTFNLYSKGASWPYSATLIPDYDLCVTLLNGNANPCKYGWGSLHAAGMSWLFGDGSVRSINQGINTAVFMALSTIGGDELLPPDF